MNRKHQLLGIAVGLCLLSGRSKILADHNKYGKNIRHAQINIRKIFTQPKANDQTEALLSFYVYMINNNVKQQNCVVFLSLDGKSPGETILHSFSIFPLRVKEVTQRRIEKSFFIDKTTGQGGYEIDANNLHWNKSDAFLVDGSIRYSTKNRFKAIFILRKSKGTWKVSIKQGTAYRS